jgi:Tfp pilus assembly protein PilF
LRSFLCGCALCLALGACMTKRAYVGPEPARDNSRPNYSSIYYYTVASYFQSQGNAQVAEALYAKALDFDRASRQILKQYLLNSVQLHHQKGLSDKEMEQRLKDHEATVESDPNLLFAQYDFFEEVEDTAGMQKTLRLLEKDFPSPKACILRFLYELKYHDNKDIKSLETALRLAQDSPDDLLLLSQIYSYYDREMAKRAILRYRELVPSEDADQMLVDAIVATQDTALAGDFLGSLNYPEDRAQYQLFVDTALQSNQPENLLPQASIFLDTKDLDLTNAVGLAALVGRRYDILEKISGQIAQLPAPEEDKQPIYALLTAYSLQAGYRFPLADLIGKLREAQYFDDILAYYGFGVRGDLAASWPEPGSEAYKSFSAQIEARLPAGPPADYLQAIAVAVQDSASTVHLTAKYDLIQYLRERWILSAADYEYVLQYYYDHDMKEQRRQLLEEAIVHYPDNALLCNDLGYYMLVGGEDREAAAKLIRRALVQEPDNPYYLDSLAWYFYLCEEYAEALDLVPKFQDMEKMPAEIALHLGAIYMKNNELEKAKQYLGKCLEISGDPVSVEEAGKLLQQIP